MRVTKIEQSPDVIVSLATFSLRLAKDDIFRCLLSLISQECEIKYLITLNIWRSDWESCSEKIKKFVEDNQIEVILTDKNYTTHNKYLGSMLKYKGLGIPFILVDDDQVYRKDMVELLYATHKKHPSAIVGGFVRILAFDKEHRFSRPFGEYPFLLSGSGEIFGYCVRTFGFGGALYPKKFVDLITQELVDQYFSTKFGKDDDKFLNNLGHENQFPIVVVECDHEPTATGYLTEYALPVSKDETAHTWMKS